MRLDPSFIAPAPEAEIEETKSDEDISRYQQMMNDAQKKAIKQQNGETECDACKQAREVLTTLMLQIDTASNMYIGYVMATILFLNIPVEVYASSSATKYKKMLLLDKLRFMILVLAFIYLIKYIEFIVGLPVAVFLYNANIDPCYIDASFVGAMGQAVVTTCAEVQALSLTFYAAQNRLRNQYFASESWMVARNYSATVTRFAGLPDNILFKQFYMYADFPFVGKCNNTKALFDSLNAPGGNAQVRLPTAHEKERNMFYTRGYYS